MQLIISHIFLFNDKWEKRTLELDEGLNIITGDSKTGKSAIIEIIDFCLFSSRSTIPKGIITNWTNLYCLVLKVSKKYIVIARPKNGNKLHFSVETSNGFLKGFSEDYFLNVELIDIKSAQLEFERHIGISVLDTRTNNEVDKRSSGGKVSMRSFTPFLFQHQNLIANKHSLFYRFDDFYRRKKTIDDYPILMGWGTSEYYSLKRKLEERQQEFKKEKRLAERLKINNVELAEELKKLVSPYMKFIGREFSEEISISALKTLVKRLPELTINSSSDSTLKHDLDKLNDLVYEKKEELDRVNELLNMIDTNNTISQSYVLNLTRLKSLASIEEEVMGMKCPLCSHEVDELNDKINAVASSKEKLLEEFEKINTYTTDSSEQFNVLRKERDQLKKEIRTLNAKSSIIRKQLLDLDKNKSFYEQAYILKGATEANAINLIQRNSIVTKDNSELMILKKEIDDLKSKLAGYNLEEMIQKGEVVLSDKMTEICSKLDFEEEFRPGKIHFNLKDFTLKYQYDGKENILLSEMGSGSNWLAIHLSTFLGFLYLHSITGSSKIPSFLILDQPSQVYFPKKYGKLDNVDEEDEGVEVSRKIDDNIVQVKNIFDVVINEINEIEKQCGYKPQVLILEHADEEEFDQFVRYRWSKEGEKLI